MCIALLICYGNSVEGEERVFTKVYGRLGDVSVEGESRARLPFGFRLAPLAIAGLFPQIKLRPMLMDQRSIPIYCALLTVPECDRFV